MRAYRLFQPMERSRLLHPHDMRVALYRRPGRKRVAALRRLPPQLKRTMDHQSFGSSRLLLMGSSRICAERTIYAQRPIYMPCSQVSYQP